MIQIVKDINQFTEDLKNNSYLDVESYSTIKDLEMNLDKITKTISKNDCKDLYEALGNLKLAIEGHVFKSENHIWTSDKIKASINFIMDKLNASFVEVFGDSNIEVKYLKENDVLTEEEMVNFKTMMLSLAKVEPASLKEDVAVINYLTSGDMKYLTLESYDEDDLDDIEINSQAEKKGIVERNIDRLVKLAKAVVTGAKGQDDNGLANSTIIRVIRALIGAAIFIITAKVASNKLGVVKTTLFSLLSFIIFKSSYKNSLRRTIAVLESRIATLEDKISYLEDPERKDLAVLKSDLENQLQKGKKEYEILNKKISKPKSNSSDYEY